MKLNRDFRKASSDSNGLQRSVWLSLWVLSFSPLTNEYPYEKLKTKDLPDYGNETLKPHRITWILPCIFWTGNRKCWSVSYIVRANVSEDQVFAEVLSDHRVEERSGRQLWVSWSMSRSLVVASGSLGQQRDIPGKPVKLCMTLLTATCTLKCLRTPHSEMYSGCCSHW